MIEIGKIKFINKDLTVNNAYGDIDKWFDWVRDCVIERVNSVLDFGARLESRVYQEPHQKKNGEIMVEVKILPNSEHIDVTCLRYYVSENGASLVSYVGF